MVDAHWGQTIVGSHGALTVSLIAWCPIPTDMQVLQIVAWLTLQMSSLVLDVHLYIDSAVVVHEAESSVGVHATVNHLCGTSQARS